VFVINLLLIQDNILMCADQIKSNYLVYYTPFPLTRSWVRHWKRFNCTDNLCLVLYIILYCCNILFYFFKLLAVLAYFYVPNIDFGYQPALNIIEIKQFSISIRKLFV